MNAYNSPVEKSGQHSKLARALTLALGLTISPFALSASGDAAPMATLVVTSCADNGFGTLRNAIDLASSGDIIDMSTLGCSTITLATPILTTLTDLTLRGSLDSNGFPTPTITTDNDINLLRHSANGTLKVSKVTLLSGKSTSGFGGCIDSFGSVELDSAALKYCSAESNFEARGGALYAKHDVKLTKSRVMGSKAISSNGTARGGGIYAGGNINVNDDSLISNNTAQGTVAHGGGIFANGALGAALNRSKITGNKAIASGGDAFGGGAYIAGEATVGLGAGIDVSRNRATGSNAKGGGLFLGQAGNIKYSVFDKNKSDLHGGGIYSKTGTLILDRCTITGNNTGTSTANGSGGGVWATALDLKKSTVSGNDASRTGGGLWVVGNTKISDSTISDNTAMGVAGASLGDSATQPISIAQSTISGNKSSNSLWGSGLFLKHNATIKNSTITGNIERNTGNQKYGAGISVQHGVAVDLSSTIVSRNLFTSTDAVTNASDIGFAGSATSATLTGSHNLIGFSLVTPMPAGTLTVDPELGPLQDNGGATWTHIPLLGSPAIGAGKANAFTTDQRGTGFPRVVGPAPDIGAVEYSVFATEIFSDGFEN